MPRKKGQYVSEKYFAKEPYRRMFKISHNNNMFIARMRRQFNISGTMTVNKALELFSHSIVYEPIAANDYEYLLLLKKIEATSAQITKHLTEHNLTKDLMQKRISEIILDTFIARTWTKKDAARCKELLQTTEFGKYLI